MIDRFCWECGAPATIQQIWPIRIACRLERVLVWMCDTCATQAANLGS